MHVEWTLGMLSIKIRIKLTIFVLLVNTGAACAGDSLPEQDATPPVPHGPWVRTADGLALRAETRVIDAAPDTLRTTVQVTNATDRPLRVKHGACALRLRAYRTPERTGRPVWASEWRRKPGWGEYDCEMILYIPELAPGDSFPRERFMLQLPVPEFLGDSLRKGRYYFAAIIRLNFDTTTLVAGDARLER